MIRPINHDILTLRQKAETATAEDLGVARDLLDTLTANHDRCVGMAANMIGVNKRIIAISLGGMAVVMLNPRILKKSKETYDTQEGCLSLTGVRPVTRHQSITLRYEDMNFKVHTQEFSGYTAQIIQHEVDHCDGILI